VAAEWPRTGICSSLWPGRPGDQVHLELSGTNGQTSLRFTLLTPEQAPDAGAIGHLRKRLNRLLFADRRYSFGQ
jgi:hypothetical protein